VIGIGAVVFALDGAFPIKATNAIEQLLFFWIYLPLSLELMCFVHPYTESFFNNNSNTLQRRSIQIQFHRADLFWLDLAAPSS
jgi:hypothetical protein